MLVSSRLESRPAAINWPTAASPRMSRSVPMSSRRARTGATDGQPGRVVGDVLVVVDGDPGGQLVVVDGVGTDGAGAVGDAQQPAGRLGRVDGLVQRGRVALGGGRSGPAVGWWPPGWPARPGWARSCRRRPPTRRRRRPPARGQCRAAQELAPRRGGAGHGLHCGPRSVSRRRRARPGAPRRRSGGVCATVGVAVAFLHRGGAQTRRRCGGALWPRGAGVVHRAGPQIRVVRMHTVGAGGSGAER